MPWFPGMNLPLNIAIEHNYANIRKLIKGSYDTTKSKETDTKSNTKSTKEPFIPTVEKR